MKFTRVTHYAQNDPEYMSDYLNIELLNEAGTAILSFSDAYHEHGQDIIKGFIMGIEYLTNQKIEVIELDIADGPEQIW